MTCRSLKTQKKGGWQEGVKEDMEEQILVHTSWEEIGISNDFLFGKIMQQPDLCRELLHRILPDLEIDHIEYPEAQKGIRPDVDAKSVRLDYSDKIIIPTFKSINLNQPITAHCSD